MSDPDLSEFISLTLPSRRRCSIALALEALKPVERVKLNAALASPVISHVAISRWLALKPREIKVGDTTVGRHRTGICRCNG